MRERTWENLQEAVRLLRLTVLLFALLAQAARAEEAFVVVAHTSAPGSQIKRETLAAAFLKQITRWSDGSAITPVDQSTRAPVRASFSQAVLRQPVVSIQNYWMQQIHNGRGLPPQVKNSDADVAAYVAKTPGAVGYVSVGFTLPTGTKVLRVAE